MAATCKNCGLPIEGYADDGYPADCCDNPEPNECNHEGGQHYCSPWMCGCPGAAPACPWEKEEENAR